MLKPLYDATATTESGEPTAVAITSELTGPPIGFTGVPHFTGYLSFGDRPPGIVNFRNNLHLFFTDPYTGDILQSFSDTGYWWSQNPGSLVDNSSGDVRTAGGPCPVEYGGFLYLLYPDINGNRLLQITSVSGGTWDQPKYIGINCRGRASAAVLNGILCVVCMDAGGNGIMVSTKTDPHPDSPWRAQHIPDKICGAPPCIVAFDDMFHIFYKEFFPFGIGVKHLESHDGVNWAEPDPPYINFNTTEGPTAMVLEGGLYLFIRDPGEYGQEDSIFPIYSTDGYHFKSCKFEPPRPSCDGQPSVALIHSAVSLNICLIAVDHGTPRIMRSELQPIPS